jgi:hypothetical protein
MGAYRAHAAFIVQPYDGAKVSTPTPTFLVWLDGNELNAEVEISSSADHSDYGFTSDTSFCFPTTPFTEAHKFTCNAAIPLSPGTYYWLMTYEVYECQSVDYGFGPVPICGYNFHVSGPFAFTVGPAGSGLPLLGGPQPTESRNDPFYTQVADRITNGKTQAVDCWVGADWDNITADHGIPPGYVELGFVDTLLSPQEVELSPEVCANLDQLHYALPKPPASLAMATAVDTLAHESIHTFGVTDEATTECYAGQFIVSVAVQLGSTPKYARRLATLWWGNYRNEPDGYWSADCHNGGTLDLNKRTKVWP